MQLSSIAPATHFSATGVVAPRTDIGILKSRHHVSELVALGDYGLRAGYTSLEQAVDAMRQLTLGDNRPGVAVFEQDGRFFAQRVLEKIADGRVSSGLRGQYLDIEDDSNLRLMPFNQDSNLRALVDGRKVLYSKFA